jgi:hypothetical protein
MRGAVQATVSRLPGAISGPRWSSWISAMTRGRSQRSARRAEALERAYRRQRSPEAQCGFDPRRQWIRQV